MQSFLARSAVNPESKPKNTHILSKQMGHEHRNTQKPSLSICIALRHTENVRNWEEFHNRETDTDTEKDWQNLHNFCTIFFWLETSFSSLGFWLEIQQCKTMNEAAGDDDMLTVLISSLSATTEEEKLWILLTPPLRPTPAWGPTKPFSSFP